jgi:hypothetical protein
MGGFFMRLLVGLALNILAYLIMPKPKRHEPKAGDMEVPTVDSGKPVPIVFGTAIMNDPMIIWAGTPIKRRREADEDDLKGKKGF